MDLEIDVENNLHKHPPFFIIILITAVFAVILLFLLFFYKSAIQTEIKEYKGIQQRQLVMSANAIEGTLVSYIDRLYKENDFLNRSLQNPGPPADLICSIGSPYYNAELHAGSIFILEHDGRVLESLNCQDFSENEKSDFLKNNVLKWWWKNHGPAIKKELDSSGISLPPLYLSPDRQLVGVFLNMLQSNGQKPLVLVYIIDIKPYIDNFVLPARIQKTGTVYILDENGRVVWDVETEIIGENVLSLHSDFPVLAAIDRRMIEEESGEGNYRFFRTRGAPVVIKEVTWTSLSFFGKKLVFAHSVPRDELLASLQMLRQRYILAAFVTAVFFSIIYILYIKTRNRYHLRIENMLRSKVEEQTDALRISLKEKDVLLKEVHHRVKNNLQIVASIINLQSEDQSESAMSILNESRNRIYAMALIHENLYATDNFSKVELGLYFSDILNQLMLQGSGSHILVKTSLISCSVDISTAVPLGLILNELLTNCIQHAFPDGAGGAISLEMEKDGDEIRITLCDDGIGLSEEILPGKTESLGISLVHNLIEQLHGSFSITSEAAGGSKAVIEFSIPAEED